MKNKISMLIFLGGLSMTINTLLPSEHETKDPSEYHTLMLSSQSGRTDSPQPSPHSKRHSDKRHSSGRPKPTDQPEAKPHHHHHLGIVDTAKEVMEQGKEFIQKHRTRANSHGTIPHQNSTPLLIPAPKERIEPLSLESTPPSKSPRIPLTNQELTGNTSITPIVEEQETIHIVDDALTKRFSQKALNNAATQTHQESTPPTSPRKLTISEILPDTQSPKATITAYFTDTANMDIPWYTYVDSQVMGNGLDMITYTTDLDEEKTVIFGAPTDYKPEPYIVIVENTNGTINKYGIILAHISDSTTTPTEKNIQQLSGYLTSNFRASDLPENTTVYKGSVLLHKHTCIIIYKNENGNYNTIEIPNTATDKLATFACITENNNVKFVIDLQLTNKKDTDSDISPKSTAKQKFTPLNGRNPRSTAIGVAFFACCIILAYKYNKLPDVFAKLLDAIFAQCSNLIPSSFTR